VKYLSVCSGIEAASVAWHPLGWEPVAFSEIEKFPSAVLAHHYPSVPNLGDMTKFQEWPDEPINLLVGGTPCQSFSVAGLRKGLADPRGNLMLTYGAIAKRYSPKWLVWENVPGVLSSNGGQDFGTFLGMLAELGYGFAYRILDAQYFRVAQRRRRVFVVGHLGDWHRAAAVLFERHSLQGHLAPSREARQGAAVGVGGGPDGGRIAGVVTRKWLKGSGGLAGDECYNTVAQPIAFQSVDHGADAETDLSPTLRRHDPMAVAQPIPIHDQATRHAGKRGNNQDGKGNGLGIGQPGDPAPTLTKGDKHAVAQPVYGTDCYNGAITGDVAATLGTPGSSVNASGPTVMQPVATVTDMRGLGDGHVAPTLRAKETANDFTPMLQIAMRVRRLTPIECERLQGFPDNYTNIPWRKKPEAPDGPRYKALGNSMAVPCMRWIGQRIKSVIAHQEVQS
jgi:DNA (cytosine-5)-methyltransferase 1